MKTTVVSILAFLVIFIVPILVYGIFTKFFGLKEPEKKLVFFVGITIQKLATVFGFITLFLLANGTFDDKWLLYGFIWFAMFAITEIGQVYLTDYSKKEAIAGIISEAIYFPLAALLVHSIL
jgi:hypothetical protein